MALEGLTSERQTALTHLNLCRRLRDLIAADISAANRHGESVALETLELFDRLTNTEFAAVNAYARACDAVEGEQNRRAGLTTQEPRP